MIEKQTAEELAVVTAKARPQQQQRIPCGRVQSIHPHRRQKRGATPFQE
jgi:hypothetical protein